MRLCSCWLVDKTNRLQPSIMKRRKYNRLYTTYHSRHATMLDNKMFQRFYHSIARRLPPQYIETQR